MKLPTREELQAMRDEMCMYGVGPLWSIVIMLALLLLAK